MPHNDLLQPGFLKAPAKQLPDHFRGISLAPPGRPQCVPQHTKRAGILPRLGMQAHRSNQSPAFSLFHRPNLFFLDKPLEHVPGFLRVVMGFPAGRRSHPGIPGIVEKRIQIFLAKRAKHQIWGDQNRQRSRFPGCFSKKSAQTAPLPQRISKTPSNLLLGFRRRRFFRFLLLGG